MVGRCPERTEFMKSSVARLTVALTVLAAVGISIPAVADAGRGGRPTIPTTSVPTTSVPTTGAPTTILPGGAGGPGSGHPTGSGSAHGGGNKAYGQSIRDINLAFRDAIKKAREDLVTALRAATTSSDRVAATEAFKLARKDALVVRAAAIASLGGAAGSTGGSTTTTTPTTSTTSTTSTTTTSTTTTTVAPAV